MKIHMIGVGGVGMSGLARLLGSRGDEVTGSDLVRTPLVDRGFRHHCNLDGDGAGFHIDHAGAAAADLSGFDRYGC